MIMILGESWQFEGGQDCKWYFVCIISVGNFQLLGGCRCQSSSNIFQVHEPEDNLIVNGD
jgi:hypothetical protein